MYEGLEHLFRTVIQYGMLALEAIGVVIILVSAVRGLILLVSKRPGSRLVISEGIAMALTFLMGSEVMKTIIAPDWHDLGMTAAILLMRAGMSLLIHWETRSEHGEQAHEESTGGADIGK